METGGHWCVARARLLKVTLFVVSILRPCQTDSHGPQGVECDGDPVRWMGESFARASSSPQSSGLWRRRVPRRQIPRFIVVGGGTSHRGIRTKSEVEAALSALGPEEIQEALRRAKEVSQPVRPNPDIIQAEAVAKVERLQRALDALGDSVDQRSKRSSLHA